MFGVRGDVVVQPMSDDPERFSGLDRVFLGRYEDAVAGSGTPVLETVIDAVHRDGRGVRLHLAALPDRTAAERAVGMLLMIPREERPPLEDGRYYVDDLVGLTVLGTDGEQLGVLAEVLRMPAHDVYVVRDGAKEFMVPAVKEFIRGVDLAARTITVALIEGMRG